MKRNPWPKWTSASAEGRREVGSLRLHPIRKALRPLFRKPAPELQVSDHLYLRSLELEQTDELFDLIESNRKHLQSWLSWIESIQNRQDCWRFIEGVRYRDVFAGTWVYGVWFEEKLVGLLDFNEGDKGQRQVAIGYWLAKSVEGRGIMTMTVLRCMDYLFEAVRVGKIQIKCASHNVRSEAIPKRLRFSWEGMEPKAGTLNGEEVDMLIYQMLAHDWPDARGLYLLGLES